MDLEHIDFGNLIIWFIVLLFSLSFHEAAHAWTSERFGDDTGRLQGRITLNPMAHIDPIGTVLFPIIGFISNFPLLGFAKPVMTNPLLWRDKTKANIAVSAAGPVSNFILAAIAFIITKILIQTLVVTPYSYYMFSIVVPFSHRFPAYQQSAFIEPLAKFLSTMLMLNVSLGVFNLIPVPPLDGSHVLESLLPPEAADAYDKIRPFGMFLLYGLLLLGFLSYVIEPIFRLVVTGLVIGAPGFRG